MSGDARIAVAWEGPAGLRAEAERLAAQWGVRVAGDMRAEARTPTGDVDVVVVVTAERLELRVLRGEEGVRGGLPVAVELLKVDATSGQGRSLRQPLARAVGLRKGEPWRPRVVDATAGFGEDAWLLASLGCDVTAVERNPVMAALLADGLRRAGEEQPEIEARMRVIAGDSPDVLRGLADDARPEVVYMDPMFPSAAERKAAERKPMRVLRMLAGGDEDAGELLAAALAAATRRVVVKRPTKAEPVGRRTPTTTHEGQSVRYDVYSTR